MDNFKIIGISTETTNENGKSIKDVEEIWGKFWGENISDKIPNKASNEIYAVYTDYESDYTGKYTLIIGFPVTTFDNIPDGFVSRNILVGSNVKYTSKGKMPEAILKTWTEIWQDTQLKRAYRADVTVHGQKYYDGDNAEVETYISIIE
jgi:predicted transcriptional regulator YdeE